MKLLEDDAGGELPTNPFLSRTTKQQNNQTKKLRDMEKKPHQFAFPALIWSHQFQLLLYRLLDRWRMEK